jgi:hypothetical protein
MDVSHSSGDMKLSISPVLASVVFKSLCDLLSLPCPSFCETMPFRKQIVPQKQGESDCA